MVRFLKTFKLPPAEEMPSKRVIASYVLDWVVIVIFAGAGGALNYSMPEERPFSLVDLSISYPLVQQSLSIFTVGLVSLAAPAIIIALACLVVVPGLDGRRSLRSPHAIRRKLWELFAAVTGLALSVALGFFITQGLKHAYGKPRPHLLAVCNPGLNNITSNIVSGYARGLDERWTLVNSSICRTLDRKELSDAFQSFPSGHCSFSWSGLLYFSLFISAKFSFNIPYLPLQSLLPNQPRNQPQSDVELLPLHQRPEAGSSVTKAKSPAPQDPDTQQSPPPPPSSPIYDQAAAPPIYGIALVLIPVGVAAYIASTRYTEYYHDGFDVISGSLIGIVTAIFSFRWYHLPLIRGQGWAWGPRSSHRAFGTSVGTGKYVRLEG